MKIKFLKVVLYLVSVVSVLGLISCSSVLQTSNTSPTKPVSGFNQSASKKEFPGFHEKYAPPDWWKNENQKNPTRFPIFKLRQDYPTHEIREPLQIWQKPEFDAVFDLKKPYEDRKKIAERYIVEVLKYAYRGNVENDWIAEKNKIRRWFHAPWLHINYREKDGKIEERNSGSREFVRGLTAERCSCRAELDSPEIGETCLPAPEDFKDSEEKLCSDASPVQNWGVAFFNEKAALTIGKVWEEMTVHERDSSKYPNLEEIGKMDFTDGSVVIKLLFTSATDTDAPILAGSRLKWNADTNRYKHRAANGDSFFSEENCRKSDENFKKCFPELRLLQIDIAVRDTRAKHTTGWVFGTFIYNKDAKSVLDGKIKPKSDWEKVEPVGLMFGNDPEVKFGQSSANLKENFIFTKLKQHLGCGGRLNGPVDNPSQSCLACHAGAEISPKYTKIATIKNPCTNDSFGLYFKNVRSGKPITPEGISLRYSLQLQAGIIRYCIANNQNCVGNGINTKFGFSHEIERTE
ncbi:MAG TPA: hypothetical protein PKY59_11975 [Pyrinomonadaceae bacterium]|nr:hypothetical protein [Pyrinomonadaceae bacterium]